MLADLAKGSKPQPATPEGWVFIVDAVIAQMNSIDDQALKARPQIKGQEPTLNHTYQDLRSLDPNSDLQRDLALRMLGESRVEDVRSAALGAAHFLASVCEAGKVKSATRHKGGGPLVELPAYKWGIDDPWPRIWRCQMDPKYPFALNVGHWIFFEEAALYQEIDKWRLQHGLERNWTLEPEPKPEAMGQPDTLPPKMSIQETVETNSGGRPPDAEKWGNLVAVMAAYAINTDIGLMKAGSLHSKLLDYAAQVGLEIPSVGVARPALGRALDMLHREHHGDGTPKFDADGNPLS